MSSSNRRQLRVRTKIALAVVAFAGAVLVAEFAVRALMPAGRLLSPTAVEVFHARAEEERAAKEVIKSSLVIQTK